MSWGTTRQPARRLARTTPRVAFLAASALTVSTWAWASPVDAAPAQASGPAAEVITLTNARRAEAGCGPVAAQSELTRAAQAHAEDMAAQDYFSHEGKDGSQPWDRAGAQGFTGNGVGENIAQGYQTPADVVEGWMNSPGHKDNILTCEWTSIGVGYHEPSRTWVQVFGQGDEEAAPPPAPAPAAPPAEEPAPEPPAPPMDDDGDGPGGVEPPTAAPAAPVVRDPDYTG